MMIRGSKIAESIRRIIQKNHRHRRRRRQRSPTLIDETHSTSFHSEGGSGKTSPTSTVVLLRHGQSLWNKIPTFTGWCDVPLTDIGIEQAVGAAHLMKKKGLDFDLVYSSELQRAHKSAEVVLEIMNGSATSKQIEPTKVWELNERQYVYRMILCLTNIRNNDVIVSLPQPSPSFYRKRNRAATGLYRACRRRIQN